MKLRIKEGVPHELDPGDNPTFDEWMDRVDSVVWRAAGCSVHDLPDCNYRDWYDERLRPVRAAARAVRRA